MYTTNGLIVCQRQNSDVRTMVLELEPDDSFSYYQWFLQKQYGTWLSVQPPMWGRHVTIIKPDETVNKLDDWTLFSGEKVSITINPENLERHWQYWSLTVNSERLQEIRRFYGVRDDFRFHMSIGRLYDWQPKTIINGIVQDIDYYTNLNSNLITESLIFNIN